MKIYTTQSRSVNIEAGSINLYGIEPLVNGNVLSNYQSEILQDTPEAIIVRYLAPDLGTASFYVEVYCGKLSLDQYLRYWIEDLDLSFCLDSFGIHVQAIENLRAYLRNGYHSWDAAFYVDPEGLAGHPQQQLDTNLSFAMTQLLPRFGSENVVLGFDRHDRFQHTFTFDTQKRPIDLKVLTLWDRKLRSSADGCESERLLFVEGTKAEQSLQEWAKRIAHTSPLPPRRPTPGITGWSSWYNLYTYLSEEIILEHLRGTTEVSQREHLPMRVFEIDDGFTPEMGDWLEVKPQFPRGMKPLLDEIRAAGFIPGLWIAPFMVGNRSQVFRENPTWVVRNKKTGTPLIQWKHYGEYRWHKRSEEYYILDTTHPDAFEYLRTVFRTWQKEWGCEYFKTDFMHFGSEHGPDIAEWHTSGMTRIEIWRQVAEMIREEIGSAIWLGCGCPLWASVGLVDGIRIGSDVGIEWNGSLSIQSLLRDLPTRNFANNILWQIDPDSILLREQYHNLTKQEVRSLAIFAGMSGGVIMTGDNLRELSNERIRLLKLILNTGESSCYFPLLGESPVIDGTVLNGDGGSAHQPQPLDPVLVQVRKSSHTDTCAIFIFNTGDHPLQRTYPLSTLGIPGPLYVFDWMSMKSSEKPIEHISVTLSAHNGLLFFLDSSPINSVPETLP